MDINRCISLSEFAYCVWSADCPVINQIFVPHTGKEENDDRAAYYGGRVTPQRKEYESKDYVEGQIEYDYDSITDYLIYPDVNSLYPAVCHKFKYAIGNWRYLTPEQIEEAHIQDHFNTSKHFEVGIELQSILRLERPLIPRLCCKVDISCPKDLITAFLVERLPSGKLTHTLTDKVGQWYWGTELEEAIILGYRITKVYEAKLFDFYADVFSGFVDQCWQGRLDNPKSGGLSSKVKNTAYKFTLNKLTGKFGQKSHPTNTMIHNTTSKHTEREIKAFEDAFERIEDFDVLFSDNGENAALVMEVQNPNPHPTYPIYLSAQILANSRVFMSRIYRVLNSYHSPDHAIYYTDTDSMILHARCLPILEETKLIGNGLGQLSCGMSSSHYSGSG